MKKNIGGKNPTGYISSKATENRTSENFSSSIKQTLPFFSER
jgi:hypothetical protein